MTGIEILKQYCSGLHFQVKLIFFGRGNHFVKCDLCASWSWILTQICVDEKSIDMAKKYPNSKHFLTCHHSLRSYTAILCLRIPPGFRITLHGEDVEHHSVVNDMMMSQEITYRPQPATEGIPKNLNMLLCLLALEKDARAHIDVQGFNVYHKNRLIKIEKERRENYR
ncbi:Protein MICRORCHIDIA 7 [Salvia divinorum]|uniref:Protein MICRORCHIDIA 7 n=1 Tax=Salvia divinorum TaxID=28513 RepID=A0ABD1IDJ7_SALDI